MIKKIVQNTKTLHVRPNGRSADYIKRLTSCMAVPEVAEIVIVMLCIITMRHYISMKI